MKKLASGAFEVIKRVLYIGFGVQMGLCFLWMCRNAFRLQEFGESYLYINAADNFIWGNQVGALYPFLLMPFIKLGAMQHQGLFFGVYLLQLIVAFYSGSYFWKSLGLTEKRKIWLGSLVIMTNPLVFQSHMAVLPNSLSLSLFILQLGAFYRLAVKKEEKYKQASLIVLAGGLIGLLWPKGLYLGMVLVVLAVVYLLLSLKNVETTQVAKQKSGMLGLVVSVVACVGMFFGTILLDTNTRTVTRTFTLMRTARLAGNCLENTYGYWPEELKSCFSEDEMVSLFRQAENIYDIFGKKAQEYLGIARADQAFHSVADGAYLAYYRDIVHDLAWDICGYTVAPVFVQLHLQDRGGRNYTARNYDIMRANSPRLTKLFVEYGSKWFVVALIFMMLQMLLQGIIRIAQGHLQRENKGNIEKMWAGKIYFLAGVLLLAGLEVLWYTFQGAGMLDYKNTLLVTVLWNCLVLKGMFAQQK